MKTTLPFKLDLNFYPEREDEAHWALMQMFDGHGDYPTNIPLTAHARGFVPSIQENSGKHIKIRWLDAGRRYTLVISRSPSDIRARDKSRATLKRLLRSPAEKNGG
jgi:hypothetical protein